MVLTLWRYGIGVPMQTLWEAELIARRLDAALSVQEVGLRSKCQERVVREDSRYTVAHCSDNIVVVAGHKIL